MSNLLKHRMKTGQQAPVQRVKTFSKQILNANVNNATLNRFLLAGLFIWRKLDQRNYTGAIVKVK